MHFNALCLTVRMSAVNLPEGPASVHAQSHMEECPEFPNNGYKSPIIDILPILLDSRS